MLKECFCIEVDSKCTFNDACEKCMVKLSDIQKFKQVIIKNLKGNEFGAAFDFTTTLYYAGWGSESNGDGSYSMLLFRVALGNVKNVTRINRLAHAPVGFHSVKKDNLHAIYRGDQVYPEFLIRYTRQDIEEDRLLSLLRQDMCKSLQQPTFHVIL